MTGLRGAPLVYAGGRADDSVKSGQRAVLFFWYSVPHIHSMKIDAETGTSGFLAFVLALHHGCRSMRQIVSWRRPSLILLILLGHQSNTVVLRNSPSQGTT